MSEGNGGSTEGGSAEGGIAGMGEGGGSVASMGNWGSSDGNWSGLGVGAGLEDGLVDVGGGSNGSDDGLLGEDGLVPQDGLGSKVGVLNGGRLDVGNWSGLMDVGGLGNGVGDCAQLWGDLGVGLSGDDAVGEVSAETVALDGSAVVLGGPDNVRGSRDGGDGWVDDAGVGDGQKASKNKESLEGRILELNKSLAACLVGNGEKV